MVSCHEAELELLWYVTMALFEACRSTFILKDGVTLEIMI